MRVVHQFFVNEIVRVQVVPIYVNVIFSKTILKLVDTSKRLNIEHFHLSNRLCEQIISNCKECCILKREPRH